jgi:hypothetical protein
VQKKPAQLGIRDIMQEGAPSSSAIADSRGLDLDYLGPEIGQQLSAIGTGYKGAKFNNLQVPKRLIRHHSSLSFSAQKFARTNKIRLSQKPRVHYSNIFRILLHGCPNAP